MARNDIKIVDSGLAGPLQSRTYKTEAAATNILAGEPVKIGGTGSNYVVPLDDAEPVVGTVDMVGIAVNDSTHTASADGTIEILEINDQTVLRAKAKSAAAVDTEAEILAILNDEVLLDLTSSTYTVDTAATPDANNGVIIVAGNPTTKTIDFKIRNAARKTA